MENIFEQKRKERAQVKKLSAQRQADLTRQNQEQRKEKQTIADRYVDELRLSVHEGTKPNLYLGQRDAELCKDFLNFMKRRRYSKSETLTETVPWNYRNGSLLGRIGILASGGTLIWQTKGYEIGVLQGAGKKTTSTFAGSKVYLCQDGLLRAAVKFPESPVSVEYAEIPADSGFGIHTGQHKTHREITGWRSIGATWYPPPDARPAGDVYEAPNYKYVTKFYPQPLEQLLETIALEKS